MGQQNLWMLVDYKHFVPAAQYNPTATQLSAAGSKFVLELIALIVGQSRPS